MNDDRRELEGALDEAWEALDEGEIGVALEAASKLVDDHGDEPEVRLLAAAAAFEAGDLAEAEAQAALALERAPDQPDALAVLAEVLFEACRFSESAETVDTLMRVAPEDARAHWLTGLLAERKGELADSDRAFARAARLDPDSFSPVPRLSREEFESAVESAVGELPAVFRERMVNVAIMVEDVPSDELLATLEEPSPDLFGLFVGIPLTEKSSTDVRHAPDAVYLFKRTLERTAADRADLIEEIRVTLLHEIGHFLGMDEEQIAEAGYE
jgi:predicted Zn-dependent protease with MMP-like domain